MRFERIKDSHHKMYAQALALYRTSFPLHEQRIARSQEEILGDENYHFNLIYDDYIFVGLLLCWETAGFIYIEHLCILPEMRNKQYGQKALELLKCNRKCIILEIDPPNDTLSIRRKDFYKRCGFIENGYPHIHPPYHKENTGHALVVMSFPVSVTKNEYDQFQQYLTDHIMANVDL